MDHATSSAVNFGLNYRQSVSNLYIDVYNAVKM